MQVFKTYFKVMRSSSMALAINLGIFLGLAILFSVAIPKTSPGGFEQVKAKIAVINRDGNRRLAQGLTDYLSHTSHLVAYPDDEEGLQDALFYRDVEYIVIIPSGFSEAFMSNVDPIIQKVTVPHSTSGFYADININRFLNTIRLHKLHGGMDDEAELIKAAKADLIVDTPITIKSFGRNNNTPQPYSYYYAYCAYALIAMIMTGVSSVMITFNQPDLYMRNICAPLTKRNMGLQLIAGHGVFALGCWGLLILGSIILHGKDLILSGLIGLYSLNTLVFAIVCTGISFLLGGSVKSHSAQAGAINVIALGMSFLGGVFVPQEIMGTQVLKVAKFLPSYWFIKANDAIGQIVEFNANSLLLRPIYSSILIQLGFALVIFLGALFFTDIFPRLKTWRSYKFYSKKRG